MRSVARSEFVGAWNNNQLRGFLEFFSPTEASLVIESTPPGANIEVDGNFVGDTPSTLSLSPGSHEVTVKKKGFMDWTRKLSVTAGSVHMNAELEQKPGE
jgi:diacylglycerol kinase family enzyme